MVRWRHGIRDYHGGRSTGSKDTTKALSSQTAFFALRTEGCRVNPTRNKYERYEHYAFNCTPFLQITMHHTTSQNKDCRPCTCPATEKRD